MFVGACYWLAIQRDDDLVASPSCSSPRPCLSLRSNDVADLALPLTLIKIKQEGAISILLVEQYLDFCLTVGDSFYIMDRDLIVVQGPVAQLNDDIVKQHLTV